jgi:hypothetical protein
MNVAFRSLDELELRMEFGDRVDLTANSRVLALDRALTETAAPGVRERETAHSRWVAAVGVRPSTYQAVPRGSTKLSVPGRERPGKLTDLRIVRLAGVCPRWRRTRLTP